MTPELHQLIIRSKFHVGAVRAVAALLPAEDAALDALVGERAQANDTYGFGYVVTAAVDAGRPVDARHLATGAMLIQNQHVLGCVAWHMQGEVPEPLLHAIEHTLLFPVVESAMLLLIADWCREHGGRALPAGFIPHARHFARKTNLNTEALGYLLALAQIAGDAGLKSVVETHFVKRSPEKLQKARDSARVLGEAFLNVCRGPISALFPAAPPRVLAEKFTMRRAVARVGRNEPCPCGSGKKYKHCCIEKDVERLHFSTDVAGKTIEEVQAEPEPHLNLSKLMKAGPHDAIRWDPRKLKPELLGKYFIKLSACHLLDRAVEAMELLGWSESLKESWEDVLFAVTLGERRDLARRLLQMRPDAAVVEEDLHLSTALLLAGDDPGKMIRLLDECALDALQSEDPDNWLGFTYGLLASQFRSLGIFVARSMIPVLPKEMASREFKHLLEARDKLNLPPEDLFGEILDERFRSHDPGEGKEADALREAQQRLDAKAREVRLLKESLDRLHHEVEQREQAPPPPSAVPAVVSPAVAAPAPVDGLALAELRRKVEGLKSALKERHNERNELRRELQEAHANLEVLRQSASSAAHEGGDGHGGAAHDPEEDWVLPAEPPTNQPVRVIEFPKRFQENLASLPKAAARSALTLLGRLAAGEPTAFVGVVRLKACPGILRVRIGSDFRLLFRLLPDRVHVVDLIPRQDLVRRIKTLV